MSKKYYSPFRKRAILALAPFLLLACEKPNEGLGFDQIIGEVPDVDRLEFPIETRTTYQDSLLVAINYAAQTQLVGGYGTNKLIGTYIDPIFGLAKSELVSELILEDLNPNFSATAVVDSAVLYLRTVGYYGDTTQSMTWRVHTLAENLSRDSAFYSSFSPVQGQEIGALVNFRARPRTTIRVDNDLVSPTMRIPLNRDYFQTTFADRGQGFASFTNNEEFRKYFMGIHISVDEGPGAILSIDPLSVNSKILIYYRQSSADTAQEIVELNFSQNKNTLPIGFSIFEQDYESYSVDFDSSATNTDRAYVQSMGGVYTRFEVPGLDSMLNKGYIINKAYIDWPISRNTTGGYPAHTALEVRLLTDEGIGSLALDFAAGGGDGRLISGNLRNNLYRMELGRELFESLNQANQSKIPTFVVVPVSKSSIPNRTVLQGGDALEAKPKVVVYYTKP